MKMRSKEERADYPYVHGANFQMKNRTSVTQNQKSPKNNSRWPLCVVVSVTTGIIKTILDLVFPDQTTTLKNNTCTYYIIQKNDRNALRAAIFQFLFFFRRIRSDHVRRVELSVL
jgi:hypothetical protein